MKRIKIQIMFYTISADIKLYSKHKKAKKEQYFGSSFYVN